MMENFLKRELAQFRINLLALLNFQAAFSTVIRVYFLSRRDMHMNKPLDRGHEQKRCWMIEWLLTERLPPNQFQSMVAVFDYLVCCTSNLNSRDQRRRGNFDKPVIVTQIPLQRVVRDA